MNKDTNQQETHNLAINLRGVDLYHTHIRHLPETSQRREGGKGGSLVS
jgi:hypothetical protein